MNMCLICGFGEQNHASSNVFSEKTRFDILLGAVV